ncbi:GIY-YIG nuclease family protein [Vibrio splendidus]|uniref:Bacteriophage T5 Orf172 DNA-binding domain-containing protein n=1 Tax=Vibrio splendidus 12E03 TaxID=1191305 RepID=A0A1E5FVI5_VIBSP|nr:hypothetical protein A142_17025 [Vibrio splendidus 12E03]
MVNTEGLVYALKSTRPEFSNALKIGYTTQTLDRRIYNASKSSTYLYADVIPVYKVKVSGISVNAVERCLFAFLEDYRMDITINMKSGKNKRPREWFTVPIEVLKIAVRLIKENRIHLFKYDLSSGTIKMR